MIQKIADFGKNLIEHLGRQSARIGVVARAMVAGYYLQTINSGFACMTKGMGGNTSAQCPNGAVMGYLSQCDDGSKIRHGRNGRCQELSARIDLGCNRLVFRWHAANGICDRSSNQLQPIIDAGIKDPAGKTMCNQCRIEKVAGKIPGKGTPGAIGATQSRGQANNQQPDSI